MHSLSNSCHQYCVMSMVVEYRGILDLCLHTGNARRWSHFDIWCLWHFLLRRNPRQPVCPSHSESRPFSRLDSNRPKGLYLELSALESSSRANLRGYKSYWTCPCRLYVWERLQIASICTVEHGGTELVCTSFQHAELGAVIQSAHQVGLTASPVAY